MSSTHNKASKPNPGLKAFEVLVGEWKTTGTHGQMPGVTLEGHASFKWIEGGAFLRMQAEIANEKFPNGIAIIGTDDALGTCFMLYFDEREVSRKNDVLFENNVLKWWRNAPGFSQRYSFTFSEDFNTIISKGELAKDDKTWEKDLDLTYTRIG